MQQKETFKNPVSSFWFFIYTESNSRSIELCPIVFRLELDSGPQTSRAEDRAQVSASDSGTALKPQQEKRAGLPNPESSVWRIIGLLFAMSHLAAVHNLL